jgi:hypothetical protein
MISSSLIGVHWMIRSKGWERVYVWVNCWNYHLGMKVGVEVKQLPFYVSRQAVVERWYHLNRIQVLIR